MKYAVYAERYGAMVEAESGFDTHDEAAQWAALEYGLANWEVRPIYTYDAAARRVNDDEALSLWDDIILYDWEDEDHWGWVVTSPTEETLNWAESTAAQGSAWPYQVDGQPAIYFVPTADCDGLVGRVMIEGDDKPGWLVYWGGDNDAIRYQTDDGRTFPTFAEAKAYALDLHAEKERDFWGHPDTVNLYEGNAGDLYVGQSDGPWFRMDNSAGKTSFTNDAYNYVLYVGSEDWGPEAAEETKPYGCPIVAEYRDGRTRYTGNAYARHEYSAGSARPGLAARAYVGLNAEGYETNDE